MNRIMIKFFKKLGEYQAKNTPRADYLAHYYWGNQDWAFKFGTLPALITLIVINFTIILLVLYLKEVYHLLLTQL